MVVEECWVYWICGLFTKPENIFTLIISKDRSWNILNAASRNNSTTFGRLTWNIESPHGTAEFLVGHAAVLLLLTPHLSHRLRLEELEDALATVLPLQQTLVPLWVDEDVPDEFPQVSASRCCRNQPVSSLEVFITSLGIFTPLIFVNTPSYRVCFSLKCRKCCCSALCWAWADALVDVSGDSLLFLSWCVSLSTQRSIIY